MTVITVPITLPELCDEVGVSYRRGDHWCRQGWISDEPGEAFCPGSGHNRGFSPAEEQRFRIMARLVLAGMAPRVAARNARRSVAAGPSGRALELAWVAGRGEST